MPWPISLLYFRYKTVVVASGGRLDLHFNEWYHTNNKETHQSSHVHLHFKERGRKRFFVLRISQYTTTIPIREIACLWSEYGLRFCTNSTPNSKDTPCSLLPTGSKSKEDGKNRLFTITASTDNMFGLFSPLSLAMLSCCTSTA